jgi:hypothetical protein
MPPEKGKITRRSRKAKWRKCSMGTKQKGEEKRHNAEGTEDGRREDKRRR